VQISDPDEEKEWDMKQECVKKKKIKKLYGGLPKNQSQSTPT